MHHSRPFTAGLLICTLLGLLDILFAFDVSDDAPPIPVLVVGAVLGIITLVGVRLAWRDTRRGTRAIAASRVLSALMGVPAFFVDDAPDWAPAAVTVAIVLTVIGLGLLLTAKRALTSSRLEPAAP